MRNSLKQGGEEAAEVFGEVGGEAAAAEIGEGKEAGVADEFAGPDADGLHVGGGVEEHADLEVHEEAAHIHVGGAEEGLPVVHEECLGVEHAGFVGEDAGTGADELAEGGTAGEVGDGVVGAFGEDQGDVAAGAGFDDEAAEEDLIGNEVGGDDPDAFLGFLDHGEDALVERVAEDVGA